DGLYKRGTQSRKLHLAPEPPSSQTHDGNQEEDRPDTSSRRLRGTTAFYVGCFHGCSVLRWSTTRRLPAPVRTPAAGPVPPPANAPRVLRGAGGSRAFRAGCPLHFRQRYVRAYSGREPCRPPGPAPAPDRPTRRADKDRRTPARPVRAPADRR